MELPKNIIQIGEPDKTHKIYVEDYVVTYMKQLNTSYCGKSKGLALYGIKHEDDEINYYFIYGAALVGGLEYRESYLSQSEKDEIELIRRDFFDGYEFIAWCKVGEERVGNIYLQVNARGMEVKGYACFYEKNEAMLNYMLMLEKPEPIPAKEEEIEIPQRSVNRGEWRAEAYRRGVHNKQEEKKVKKQGAGGTLSVAALAVFCVAGFLIISDPEKMEELQVVARQVMENLTEQKLTDEELPDEALEMQLPDLAEGEVSRREEPDEEIEVAAELTEPDTGASELVDGAAEGQAAETEVEVIHEAEPEDEIDVVQEVVEEAAEADSGQIVETAVSGGDGQETVGTNVETVYTTYLIKEGDTLIQICMTRYGSLEHFELICSLNGIGNPDNIEVGQIILLP